MEESFEEALSNWENARDDRRQRMSDARQQQSQKKNGYLILSKGEFVDGYIAPDYLFDGMLQRRFVYSLTGSTGHAKTALALLFAELVSTPGLSYLGKHRVEHGRVIYFAGENPEDLRMRVIGADSCRSPSDRPLDDEISFIPGTFNIGQMFDALQNDILKLAGCDLIIIDTSAAYFLGNEEMSNTQMATHARMLRALTTLPGGPCVLVLCHPIKYVTEAHQLLPRGGGAFLAEMDGNLTVWKHDDLVELHHNKIRGPGFEPMSFRLEPIRTDRLVDSKGRLLPTVRAVWLSEADEDRQTSKAHDDEDRVLVELLKMTDDERVSQAGIAKRLEWFFTDGEPAKSRVQRVLDRLEKSKSPLVRNDRGQYVLTEKGKESARKAALKIRADEERKTKAKEQFEMPYRQ